MSPIEAIGTLIIRLWAAATVIFNLPLVFIYVAATNTSGGQNQIDGFIVFYYPSIVLLGMVLWVFAHKIASVLTPRTGNESVKLAVDPIDLVAIGSFLIGLYHLATKLPGTLYQSASLVYKFSQIDRNLYNFDSQIENLIVQWIVVLVALGLTFRPRDIARMFMWLRSAGPQSVTDTPEMDGEGK